MVITENLEITRENIILSPNICTQILTHNHIVCNSWVINNVSFIWYDTVYLLFYCMQLLPL